MRGFTWLLTIGGAAIAIFAGLYLIGTEAAQSDSLFNPLLHGMGAYFVARGVWMIAEGIRSSSRTEALERMVEGELYRHERESTRQATAE